MLCPPEVLTVPHRGYFVKAVNRANGADAKDYSHMMGEDEVETVETITACRAVMTTLIREHRGRVVDAPGDNILAEFASVVDAVASAVAIQKELKKNNDQLPEHHQMMFRMGINLGDVIEEDEWIYGDGVNILIISAVTLSINSLLTADIIDFTL